MTNKEEKREAPIVELSRLANNAIVSINAFYASAIGHAHVRIGELESAIERLVGPARLAPSAPAKDPNEPKPKPAPTTKKAAAKGPSLEDAIVGLVCEYIPKPIAYLGECAPKSPAYRLGEARAQHFEIPTEVTKAKIVDAAIECVEADKLDPAPHTSPAFKKIAAAVDALQRKRRRAKKRG